jgi:hypothetical protein
MRFSAEANPVIAYTCYVCDTDVPFTLDVSHHKIPRAYGGQDGSDNEVPVCTRCHDVLHRVALMLRNKHRIGLVDDTLITVYPCKKARDHVRELAMIVNKYALQKKEKTLDNIDNLEEQLTITLPTAYKAKLRILANETKDSDGRRLGMARFVQKFLIDLLDKHFGRL